MELKFGYMMKIRTKLGAVSTTFAITLSCLLLVGGLTSCSDTPPEGSAKEGLTNIGGDGKHPRSNVSEPVPTQLESTSDAIVNRPSGAGKETPDIPFTSSQQDKQSTEDPTLDIARDASPEQEQEWEEPLASHEPMADASNLEPLPQLSVTGGAGMLTWQPEEMAADMAPRPAFDNANLTITGTGGGEMIQQDFGYGESISVATDLPDGVYNWQITVTPSIAPEIRARMAEVRQAGNLKAERNLIADLRQEGAIPTRAEARGNVQSGSFRIQDGMTTRDAVEE